MIKEILDIKRLVQNRKKDLHLPNQVFFLNEDAVLCYPREDGDNRYPLDCEGYTAWCYSSGYIHVREGGFYSLAWRQDGEDPDVDFFAGLSKPNGKYEVFSLLGIPVDPIDSSIVRYTVFTPTAAYYFTEYQGFEFCVRVHLAENRKLYFTVLADNKSGDDREVLLSSYFDPFLRRERLKDYDWRWFEESHVTDSKVNNLNDGVAFAKEHRVYALIQSAMSVPPERYETTTSRDDYIGGKNRSLANNTSLTRGHFAKGQLHCSGTHNAVIGDIRCIKLKDGEAVRTDICFRVFAGEIPESAREEKLISEEIDTQLQKRSAYKKESDNRLKIVFGKSTDPQICSDSLNCFLQFVKRQTEFCSFSKYYAWAEHLGIRDVWQQLEPTLLWKTEDFPEKALELLSVTETNGRSPRQYGPPVLDFPIGFDLREYIDQGIWLLDTLNLYLKYSGDLAFFEKQCGYYIFPKEKTYITEHGCYPSEEKDSVCDHMIRILDYLLAKRDKNTGCVRILNGDWDDPVHLVTEPKEPGEHYGNAVSVMASLQVYRNIKSVIEVLETVDAGKYAEKIKDYCQKRKELADSILREAIVTDEQGNLRILHAWGDDKSFLVGSFCDGDGKSRISLIVQAFWILSEMIEIAPQMKQSILENLKKLDSTFGFKTFDVPFDPSFECITGITDVLPGTLENATAYVHAATFATHALYQIGETRLAWDQFKKLIPITHAFTSHSPYVMANSYMENHDYEINGDSINDWMTGSAPMILKIVIFDLCGYQPQIDGVKIAPAKDIPFEDFSFSLLSPKGQIRITYRKHGEVKRTFQVNGEMIASVFDEAIGRPVAFVPYEKMQQDAVTEILVLDE